MIDLLWLPGASHEEREASGTDRRLGSHPGRARTGQGSAARHRAPGQLGAAGGDPGRRGYPVNVVVETLEPPAWNDRVQAIRERIGLRAIPIETGVRECTRRCVATRSWRWSSTGRSARAACRLHFFGAETRIPEGVARMAIRTGAAVIGAVGIRRGTRFVAARQPAVRAQPTGDRERDVASAQPADRGVARGPRPAVPRAVVHVPRLLARRQCLMPKHLRDAATVAAYRLALPLCRPRRAARRVSHPRSAG